MCVVEDGFQQLAQDLTESDLYIRYLNEEEEVRYVCVCVCLYSYCTTVLHCLSYCTTVLHCLRDDQRTDDDHAPQLMSTITESMEK